MPLPDAVSHVRDRLLGTPEGGTPRQLQRILHRGGASLRIRAIRELGLRPDPPVAALLVSLLTDPVPGVRRAAAWGLGWSQRGEGAVLLAHAQRERCDEVRLAMAVAAVRCGADVAEGWAVLAAAAGRTVETFYGTRRLAEAISAGVDRVASRWRLALAPADDAPPSQLIPQPAHALRQEALVRLERDPEARQNLQLIGAQQHPADLPLLLRRYAGRRTRHSSCEALGMHGDPRAIPHLVQTLQSIVDPGQGFANRRISGEALGRIGSPEVGRILERALEQEAMEFEGRPGAGLGIQFPVRSVLLVAMGEAGAHSSVLAGYLSNTHGSALGGFYLPAMDALSKLGDPAPLLPLLRSGEALVVANALGVLGTLGQQHLATAFIDDPRQRVARVAAAVLTASS